MNRVKKKLRTALALIIILPAAYLLVDTGLYFFYPDLSSLERKNPGRTAFMRHAEEAAQRKGKKLVVRQVWVPLAGISKYLVNAVIIAEDDKFWRHEGFDFEAMKEAIEKDLKAGRLKYGGSTITQQLVKNLYLSPSKNPMRKLKEAILAWRLERELSKRRILELYLNVVEWGEGIFGIEAASRHYYGKPASELSPEEAARLAAVLPNPRRFSPVGQSRYVENRARIINYIMLKRGIVEPAEPAQGIENAPEAEE
jgi:monofunctional biosynthetic peptidoglycan transglycosylase